MSCAICLRCTTSASCILGGECFLTYVMAGTLLRGATLVFTRTIPTPARALTSSWPSEFYDPRAAKSEARFLACFFACVVTTISPFLVQKNCALKGTPHNIQLPVDSTLYASLLLTPNASNTGCNLPLVGCNYVVQAGRRNISPSMWQILVRRLSTKMMCYFHRGRSKLGSILLVNRLAGEGLAERRRPEAGQKQRKARRARPWGAAIG